MVLDIILEFSVGLVAIVLAYIIYKNKGNINTFSWGFILIALSAIFDVVDEFITHIFIDVGGKTLFIVGLIFISFVFHKELKV
jgi:multisubunit Na+/H+ antiporter MnhB subunit